MDEPALAQLSLETQGSVGYEVALAYGIKVGLTDKAAKDLAELVKGRIESNIAKNETIDLSQT